MIKTPLVAKKTHTDQNFYILTSTSREIKGNLVKLSRQKKFKVFSHMCKKLDEKENP